MNYNSLKAALAIAILLFAACEPDDPIIPNEEEVITTLTYTLTPDGGGDAIILRFQDLDGDGGDAPIIEGGILATNQSYVGTLDLLNEQETPASSISDEILEEDEDHQFFFQTDITGLNVTYSDQDADGNPIGLRSQLTTTEAGKGTLTLILRHEPYKSASGVSNGDITSAGGETDIEVSFDIDVQ